MYFIKCNRRYFFDGMTEIYVYNHGTCKTDMVAYRFYVTFYIDSNGLAFLFRIDILPFTELIFPL